MRTVRVTPIPDSVTVKISNHNHMWQGEKLYIMIDRLMHDTNITEALIFHTCPESQDMKRYILHTDRKKPGPLLRVGPIKVPDPKEETRASVLFSVISTAVSFTPWLTNRPLFREGCSC